MPGAIAGAILGVALVVMLRRGAPLIPRLTLLFAGLAVAATVNLGLLLLHEGDVSIMDMHYLVAEAGRGVAHFVDRHELGLFATERTLAIMREAGFKAEYLEEGLMAGRGVYVATKPAP